MTQLGLREELQYGRRQNVCGGVTIDVQRLGVPIGQQAQFNVFFQWFGQVSKNPSIFKLRRMHAGGRLFIAGLARFAV